jgi:dipeptidyl aminopeptidase/acylaminoacyl peptidase
MVSMTMTKIFWLWPERKKGCLAFGMIFLIALLFSGCESGYADFSEQVVNSAQSLPVPRGRYSGPAWLDGNQIAFVYIPEELVPGRDLWWHQIALYNIDTQEWRVLTLPRPDKWPALIALEPNECKSGWIKSLSRLPNGKLGFIYQCNVEREHVTDSISTLYMWDWQSDTLQVLQRYPVNFYPSSYAFAPDMSNLIQEQSDGGLGDEFYRVSQDGHLERLFPNYQRVISPSWSPDGQTIAFMGTEIYPGNQSNQSGSYAFIDLLHYPWDLYLMDADGGNVRLVLSQINGDLINITKWVPQRDLLSFRGRYNGKDKFWFNQGKSGIWVVDPTTSELTWLYPEETVYDWSPDGRQMVVIEREEKEGVEYSDQLTYPVIIDVPIGQ